MRKPSSGGHPDEPQATVHLREGVEIPVIVALFEVVVDGDLGDQAIVGTARRDALQTGRAASALQQFLDDNGRDKRTAVRQQLAQHGDGRGLRTAQQVYPDRGVDEYQGHAHAGPASDVRFMRARDSCTS